MNSLRLNTRTIARPRAARAWWLALGLLCGSPSALAYDLWQAYQDAQVNDPTYLASIAQKEVYDAQGQQARAAIMPTLTLSGGIYKKRNSFLVNPRNVIDNKTTPASLMLEVRQPILAFDKITRVKQINNNTQVGAIELAQARQDLISRVVQAYFTAWLSQRNTQIAQAVVVAAERQFAMAKKNFEVGNTTVIDTQEAQTVLHNAQAALIDAQGNADNARAALGFLVGHPITEPLSGVHETLKLKMPVPSTVQSWIERAQQSNPSIKIAQLQYRNADLETTRMGQQRLPQVSVVANKRWNSLDYKGPFEEKTEAVTLGLELSMPIFDSGYISGQEREANSNKSMSFQSLRATQNAVAQTTRAAYNQAVGGLATISALTAAQGSAQKSADSNLLGYQLGMRINVDVLNAQNTYAQAQYNLAQAQYNTILGNVNLKAAIGELGEEDVRFINDLLRDPAQTQ